MSQENTPMNFQSGDGGLDSSNSDLSKAIASIAKCLDNQTALLTQIFAQQSQNRNVQQTKSKKGKECRETRVLFSDSSPDTVSSMEGNSAEEDEQEVDSETSAAKFQEHKDMKRLKWADVTNEEIQAEVKSKALYVNAALTCYPGLNLMRAKFTTHGLITPFNERDGREFEAIINGIINRERNRCRTYWLDFLHKVCDPYFNECEPKETGM